MRQLRSDALLPEHSAHFLLGVLNSLAQAHLDAGAVEVLGGVGGLEVDVPGEVISEKA